MSKKRTPAESNNYEATNEGSDLLQQDNAKHGKLTPLSETTLQDLPIQLLERILTEAVAKEVKGMKLAKSVWKEKVDPVIGRLKDVCSRWNSMLTTYTFRNEVDRILDGTAQETIRLEILHQSWIYCFVLKVAAMKEEMFVLCIEEGQSKINVYDDNNMTDVKDVIALPGRCPVDMEACNVSNCLYVSLVEGDVEWKCPSILRITKDDEHKFNILLWISDLRLPFCNITVSPNGMLFVPHGKDPSTVSIYDANGALLWSTDIRGFRFVDKVIQKSNGNLVLASLSDDRIYERSITEINTEGRTVRQYKSSLTGNSDVNFADIYGRIVIIDPEEGIELLDSELNLLDSADQQLGQRMLVLHLHYNRERNEVMSTCSFGSDRSVLAIFRFAEEKNHSKGC